MQWLAIIIIIAQLATISAAQLPDKAQHLQWEELLAAVPFFITIAANLLSLRWALLTTVLFIRAVKMSWSTI